MPHPISKSLSDFIQFLKTGDPKWGIPPHNAPELLDRWSINMECQINIQSALGTPVEGRKGVFVDDSMNEFWNFRIPKGANTNEPVFNDYPLTYPLAVFAAGIGCTGWDWQHRASRWVAFDFDALVGHAQGVGIAAEELTRVKEAACQLPWVETRNSTGGSGLHLYVPLDAIPTENHTVHAALARTILGMMGTETGFDFASRIDACGGNTWIWHRKMTTENNGLKLIKPAGCSLSGLDLPTNWRDNVDVVKRKRSKVTVQGIENENTFDKLAGAQQCVQLDDQHRECIAEVGRMNYANEWVADHNCWRTHTKALAELCERITIKGIFRTSSEGRDPGTANVFGFPLPNGGWRFFRFSPGVSEAPTWNQDGVGWTSCSFNVMPDLKTAARAEGGKLHSKRGGYHFDHARDAIKAIQHLGQTVKLSPEMEDQPAMVKLDREGHVVVEVTDNDGNTGDMSGWVKDGKAYHYSTEIIQQAEKPEIGADNIVRNVVTPAGREAGWLLKCSDEWKFKAKDTVKAALLASGVKRRSVDLVLGEAALNDWKLVNLPFKSEFPGGRQINLGAAKLAYDKADEPGPHPHWDMILSHSFRELDSVLPGNEWATTNNIVTGRDYGMAWIACLFREPHQPLPYLFLHSKAENTGKSIVQESIRSLLARGAIDGALALKADFNGELENKILAYIDDFDLSVKAAGQQIVGKIKRWVTSQTIPIRRMRTDVYEQLNTLHFIHTANGRGECPVFPGDTRIVFLEVAKPAVEIPKPILLERLKKEAPAFLWTIDDMTLPSSTGRLRIPVIDTNSKRRTQDAARSPVEEFIDEACEKTGETVAKELYDQFVAWCRKREIGPIPRNRTVYAELADRGFNTRPGTANKLFIQGLTVSEVTA